jgi:hypothetical protein
MACHTPERSSNSRPGSSSLFATRASDRTRGAQKQRWDCMQRVFFSCAEDARMHGRTLLPFAGTCARLVRSTSSTT